MAEGWLKHNDYALCTRVSYYRAQIIRRRYKLNRWPELIIRHYLHKEYINRRNLPYRGAGHLTYLTVGRKSHNCRPQKFLEPVWKKKGTNRENKSVHPFVHGAEIIESEIL